MNKAKTVAASVGKLHSQFSMSSNDLQIVLRGILSHVEAARHEALALPPKGRRSFRIKRTGPRERTGRNAASIVLMYERFVSHEIWEAFLVYNVAQ